MVLGRKNPHRALEKAVGYTFKKKLLLERALTHRSYRFEHKNISHDNQRLEFLGDAVLGLVTAVYVYDEFKKEQEGFLTSFRSQVTSGKALAEIARTIGLGEYLEVGKGEARSGGKERASNLADSLESVIGAAYIDGGIKAAQKIFKKIFVPYMETLETDAWSGNPKGELQEYSQHVWKKSPSYNTIAKEGPPHATIFTVEVVLNNGDKGCGRGLNKQEAETKAAQEVLKKINKDKVTQGFDK